MKDSKAQSLNTLPIGSVVKIDSILTTGEHRRRILDLGLIPGSIVTIERSSPSGNPIAYRIRGSLIALRNEEAQSIKVNIL
ncbi:ferrous iron transport protein A [Gottschalkia acidurici 9a]|uniref:Ferrous iron transport protein A n=1 Tax=Gottschalkia acidurici (strain ATCC 7906 / DSM 604 / BCRC 14475 / CIP 104303 / KCTC 5404 / NCIMB 10678 / 9a) TaxID=1128398 RepID=K0B2Q0_GOTA9|nr:FeoA family protein [Gottschalkia acidurici]AFS79220.1 ferrous iron transport protein A [Gottschalkia acidurici 9a]